MSIRATLSSFVLVSSAAVAAPAPKVNVCHWQADNGAFKVLNISSNALAAHTANHASDGGVADHLAGTFYADADGDGYGDAGAATSPCLNAGFVANADDCDDGDAAVNPAATEACGDGIDNNCAGGADEGCNICPCYTAADIDAAWARYQAHVADTSNYYVYNYVGCEDYTYSDPYYGGYYSYHYGQVYFQQQSYSSDSSQWDYDSSYFYGVNYDGGYAQTEWGAYCAGVSVSQSYDYTTGQGEYTEHQNNFMMALTDAEAEACSQLALDWAAANGFTCQVYNY